VKRKVTLQFQQHFGAAPEFLARAPGRVNLIGEHTDYNGGFVLPMAIDRTVYVALRRRNDRRVVIHSADYKASGEFDLDALERADHDWLEYIKGVAWVLEQSGERLGGWDGVISGDVPSGAGLSSSAAVELAVQCAFAAVGNLEWNALEAARRGQRVENEWIGVKSGIMDQAVIASAVADHALLIDCRNLEVTPVPLPPAAAVVVLDTSTRRGLVDSKYNERRQQCEAAARWFGVELLRDVDAATFAAGADRLDPLARARARHVISENARTCEAAGALLGGDVVRFGQLMNESHASLRDDFQVTNHELDAIVSAAQEDAACFGARMTGAGFGGCAVALVEEDQAERFIADVTAKYLDTTNLQPHAYICRPAAGANWSALD